VLGVTWERYAGLVEQLETETKRLEQSRSQLSVGPSHALSIF
jgi:hypothetical protein